MARYRSAFTKTELIGTDTVACAAGEAKVLGKYKVEAGELIELGYGLLEGQESASGRIFMDLKNDANAAINGTIRISVQTPQDRHIMILKEYRTEQLAAGAGDRTKQIPLPETGIEISEDKKIVLEFVSDAAVTLSKANSTILLDITRTQA